MNTGNNGASARSYLFLAREAIRQLIFAKPAAFAGERNAAEKLRAFFCEPREPAESAALNARENREATD